MVGDNGCEIQIVVDTNSEQNLWQLENLEFHPKRIVLTNNPCPEYLDDLQLFEPMALIYNPNTALIKQALEATQTEQTTNQTPKSLANLSLKERIILRFIAVGLSDKEIGDTIGLEGGSVRNIISRELLPKLQKTYPTHCLKNRGHLARFYLGGMHFLRGNQKIPHSLIPMLQAEQIRRENETLAMYGFEPHEKEEARDTLEKIFANNPQFFRIMYGISKEPILPRTHRVKRRENKI